MSDARHVLVTTEYRGVFMGKLVEDCGTKVTLEDAQMCIYWDSSTHGVFGLAAVGPGERCKIGHLVPGRTTLRKVTCICDVTAEAVERWRSQPWS